MDMKLKTIFYALFGAFFLLIASEDLTLEELVRVQMPNEEVLRERLYAHTGAFETFIEKTGIVKNLAGRELYALGVAQAVEN